MSDEYIRRVGFLCCQYKTSRACTYLACIMFTNRLGYIPRIPRLR